MKKATVPVCLIGNYDEEMPADAVGLNQSEGFLAMDHLIRIGRKRIAYAGGPKHLHRGARFAAYEKTLSENFMPIVPELVFNGDRLTIDTGIAAARYFHQLQELPDAVFAANDLVAIGVIQGFLELGVRVPEDVAVIGIDDINWCTLIRPKVSSVSNLVGEMGRIAAELLLQRIDDGHAEPKRVQLEPRLIVRESTVKSY
jgi:LacI family transcriptional regulator